MQISVQGADELSKYVNALFQYVQNPVITFKKAKVKMHTDVMQHFKKQEGPDGKWQALSKLTILRRKGGGKGAKILQNKGFLKGSVAGISGKEGAEVGTNMVYARTHQMGDKERNIPKRTFVWLSDVMSQRILDDFIADMKELR